MRLPKQDIVATVLVLVSGLVYLLWAVDSAVPGTGSTRASGIVVLALGFVASASAVVPGFNALLHGNKAYLTITSTIGLVAFAGGVAMLVGASGAGFSVMTGALGVLWLISTTHHVILAKHASSAPSVARRPETKHRHWPHAAGAH
jgi:hypothetical protein